MNALMDIRMLLSLITPWLEEISTNFLLSSPNCASRLNQLLSHIHALSACKFCYSVSIDSFMFTSLNQLEISFYNDKPFKAVFSMLNVTNLLCETDVKQCPRQKIMLMINSKSTKVQRRDLWNKSYWGSDWSVPMVLKIHVCRSLQREQKI